MDICDIVYRQIETRESSALMYNNLGLMWHVIGQFPNLNLYSTVYLPMFEASDDTNAATINVIEDALFKYKY